jgi:hypothetical protein
MGQARRRADFLLPSVSTDKDGTSCNFAAGGPVARPRCTIMTRVCTASEPKCSNQNSHYSFLVSSSVHVAVRLPSGRPRNWGGGRFLTVTGGTSCNSVHIFLGRHPPVRTFSVGVNRPRLSAGHWPVPMQKLRMHGAVPPYPLFITNKFFLLCNYTVNNSSVM